MLKKITASMLAIAVLFGSGAMTTVNVVPEAVMTAGAEAAFGYEDIEVTMVYTNAAGKEYEAKGSVSVGDDTLLSPKDKDDPMIDSRKNWNFEVEIDEIKKAMDGDLRGLEGSYKISAPASDAEISDGHDCYHIPHIALTESFYNNNGEFMMSAITGVSMRDQKLARDGSEYVGYEPSDLRVVKMRSLGLTKIVSSYSIFTNDEIRSFKSSYHDVFDDLDAKLTYTNSAGKTASYEGRCRERGNILTWEFDLELNDLKAAMGDDLDGLQYSLDISARMLEKGHSYITLQERKYSTFTTEVLYDDCAPDDLAAWQAASEYLPMFEDISGKVLDRDGAEFKNMFTFESTISGSIPEDSDGFYASGRIVTHVKVGLSIDADEIVPDEATDEPDDSSSDKPDDTSSKPDTEPKFKLGDVNADGNIDIEDVVAVINHINGLTPLTAEEEQRADVDGNAMIDIEDAVAIINHINGVMALEDRII